MFNQKRSRDRDEQRHVLRLPGYAHYPLMVDIFVADHVSVTMETLEVIAELREPASKAMDRKSWFLERNVEAVGVECADQCYSRCRN